MTFEIHKQPLAELQADMDAVFNPAGAKAELARLRALNAELVAALRGIRLAMRDFAKANPNIRFHGPEVVALERAGAAIAKAKEGTAP